MSLGQAEEQVELVGRDAERARIGALLDAAHDSRSGALVLRGEPGIGKTALLDDARSQAEGMQVLAARGVETESELPFGALDQLLRPALDRIERIPAPQATALRRALGLEEGVAEERFLVSTACLSLLSELSEGAPVLCIVDDAHWLDEASADALSFVARRLGAEGIAMLFAAREGEVREFAAPDVPSLRLGGLDATAARRLLDRVAADAAPAVHEHLVSQAHGNALALVELPTALSQAQLAGDEALPEVLPLTDQVERLFLDRVRRLPEETQRALLVAAADDAEDAALVTRAASRLGADGDALGAAEEAGLVTVRGASLEFRHPLVRSAVYQGATSSDRRAAHSALAESLARSGTDADRRVWHLAAAIVEPDADVVRALDDAAARAEERAAHTAAARMLERSAELSAGDDARGRRLVGAARNLSLAGRNEEAVACAQRAERLVVDPSLHAELAQVRAVAAIRGGRPYDVVPVLLEVGRDVAATDPARAVKLLMDASITAWQSGDRERFLEIAELVRTIAPAAGDDETARRIRTFAGFAAMASGDAPEGAPILRELVTWAGTADDPNDVLWGSFAAFWLGDAIRFGALVERVAALSRSRGELGTLAEALGMRSTQMAFEQFRFEEVTVAATEAVALARELRARNLELLPRTALAIVAAIQGRDEEARGEAEAVLAFATENGLRLRVSAAVYALALVDLGRARWSEALSRLEALSERYGQLDPVARATLPDLIEAAVRAGRVERAQAALPELERRVEYSGLPSARLRLAACRALLAEGDEATAHFDEALAHAADARPFDLARIRLMYGEHLRRERRRVDAREQLRAALDAFERFAAEPWAERARTELRASGETARKRDPSTIDELTPQELQISRLVIDGLSNKEVAAQLFLSPRTIDYHLRNVFTKLGISSRTQLAGALTATA